MKLGLVLEGGGLRGMYTAGVLDWFLEKDFFPDGIAGVSAGACHACSYAAGQKGRSFRITEEYGRDPRYMSLRSLLLTGDYFNAHFAYDRIPNELIPIDYAAFDKRKDRMPFYAVVTDVHTGKAKYARIRDMHRDVQWVRASASLPMMAQIVEIDGGSYLDGGIADSIPLRFMRKQGFDKNIVVLTRPKGYRKEANKLMRLIALRYERCFPELVKAMAARHIYYNRTLDRIEELEAAGEIFVIRPSVQVIISRLERDQAKIRAIYELGYQDAMRQFEAMRTYVGR